MTLEQPAPGRKMHPRNQHRARAHESAHATIEPGSATIPEHPLICRGQAAMVTDQSGLMGLIEHVRQVGSFAYDSEFIGELSYVPRLCLIQVATAQRVVLVDPLANLDLRPFWELLADERVEKIVHAGLQDLEPVVRHLGRGPANVFDTQMAAGFIGMSYPTALSKLVRELLGVRLGKGFTFTHWDQRPLSAVQLRYAADDVRYLPALRAAMGQRLASAGHTQWAMEECAGLGVPSLYRVDPAVGYLRVRGAGGLSARGLAILRELYLWRDGAARAHDLPPRSFLKDEILLELARNPIRSVKDLDRVRGLPRPVEQAHGQAILDATRRAMALPEIDLPQPQNTEESVTQRFAADALWSAAQSWCYGQGIDPALVTSRQELGELYRSLRAGQDVSNMDLMKGWRRPALGEMVVQMVGGRAKMELDWNRGALRAMDGAAQGKSGSGA